jgi:hypothetical protein
MVTNLTPYLHINLDTRGFVSAVLSLIRDRVDITSHIFVMNRKMEVKYSK